MEYLKDRIALSIPMVCFFYVATLNYGAIGYAVFGEGVLSIPIALFVLWIACLLAIFEVDVISKLWNFAKKKWSGRRNG
jgi:hypothetical protein